MKKITLAALIFASIGTTFAAESRWTEGYGQGNLEYFIDKDGVRLLVGCPTQEGSADAYASVSLYKISNDQQVSKFTITANGITFDAPFEADSRVGTNNLLALIEALRKDNAVVLVGGKKITFPKSNAAKVIPAYGKKFACNLG